MSSLAEQIVQLEAAIAAQEGLRATLGDAAVEATLTALRHEIATLRAQPHTPSLDAQLRQLQSADLIRPYPTAPDLEYIFKHALTQTAAYNSLLFADRKALHRKVGEALEMLTTGQPDKFDGILGEHFRRGEQWDKAAEYLSRAGELAAQRYADTEARQHYTGALDALTHLPDTADHRRRHVDLLIEHARLSLDAEAPEPILARMTEAESLTHALTDSGLAHDDDRLRLARVQLWAGRALARLNRPHEAIRYYRQVLAVAQEFGDEALAAIPASAVGRALFNQGRFGEAEPLLARAVEPLETSGNWPEWISNIATLGMTHAFRGRYAAGVAEGQRGLAQALKLQAPSHIAFCYATLGITYTLGDDLSQAVAASRTAVALAEQSNDRIIVCIGYATWAVAESRMGQHEAALTHLALCQAIAQSLGGQLLVADRFAVAEAEVVFSAGRVEQALNLAEQAVVLAHSIGGLYGEGRAQRVWGQALATISPPRWAEADAHFAESMRLLESGEARLEAARTRVAWGLAYRHRSDVLSAREHFEKAAGQFEISELKDELHRTRKLITELNVAQ